jgi:hypothetical protein
MANAEQLAILKQSVKAWKEWRKENPYDEVDLTNADLTGADLWGAKLREASLWGANLREASLIKTDLSKTDLSKTDLIGADLWRANLQGANLSGANLTDADLQEVNLSVARCSDTIFSGIDLSLVKGLETVEHYGRNYLDIHTLYESKGEIPEVFLRGCGVPEEFILYIPSLTGRAIEFYSCFISYNHQDKTFARRVHDTLQMRGIRCWLDEKQVNPGDDIYREVDRGIKLWDKVLLCASEHSLKSWWVDSELNRLFKKEQDLTRERGEKVLALIPLDLDGHLLSKEYQGDKSSEITSRLTADFKGWEHDNAIFEREIERVIKALRTDGGKVPPPTSKL